MADSGSGDASKAVFTVTPAAPAISGGGQTLLSYPGEPHSGRLVVFAAVSSTKPQLATPPQHTHTRLAVPVLPSSVLLLFS